MSAAFVSPADAAFALLTANREGRTALTRKAGGTVADATPLSAKQTEWLQALLAKAGLPPLQIDGGARG